MFYILNILQSHLMMSQNVLYGLQNQILILMMMSQEFLLVNYIELLFLFTIQSELLIYHSKIFLAGSH